MITKITMFTDPSCVTCAVMEKVMEEFCANKDPKIEFNIMKSEDIQDELKPLAYPTFRLYEKNTHSVLRISMGGLEPIKKFITGFDKFIEDTW